MDGESPLSNAKKNFYRGIAVMYELSGRNSFFSLTPSEGPMVFCGLEHNYTRRHINSDFNETINDKTFKFNKFIYQVTTGTFGAPFYKDYTEKKDVDVPPILEYHFAIVDINGDRTQVTVYNLDGKVIDYFEQ